MSSFVLLLHIIVIILVTIKKFANLFIFLNAFSIHLVSVYVEKMYICTYIDGFVTLIEIVHYRFVPLHFERLNP